MNRPTGDLRRTLERGQTIQIWIAPHKQWAIARGMNPDSPMHFYIASYANLKRFVNGVVLDPDHVHFNVCYPVSPNEQFSWPDRWPNNMIVLLQQLALMSGSDEVEIKEHLT